MPLWNLLIYYFKPCLAYSPISKHSVMILQAIVGLYSNLNKPVSSHFKSLQSIHVHFSIPTFYMDLNTAILWWTHINMCALDGAHLKASFLSFPGLNPIAFHELCLLYHSSSFFFFFFPLTGQMWLSIDINFALGLSSSTVLFNFNDNALSIVQANVSSEPVRSLSSVVCLSYLNSLVTCPSPLMLWVWQKRLWSMPHL